MCLFLCCSAGLPVCCCDLSCQRGEGCLCGLGWWARRCGPSCVHIIHIGVVQVEQGVACCCLTHHHVAPHRNMHTIVRIFNKKFLKSLLQERSFNHSLQSCDVLPVLEHSPTTGSWMGAWIVDTFPEGGHSSVLSPVTVG